MSEEKTWQERALDGLEELREYILDPRTQGVAFAWVTNQEFETTRNSVAQGVLCTAAMESLTEGVDEMRGEIHV